jgi:hypothetical protein
MKRSHAFGFLFALGAAGALAACTTGMVERPVAQAAPDVPPKTLSAESEIYAILVAHALSGGRTDTLFLAAESPAYQELPADSFLRRGKEVVPRPLPARLSVLSVAGAAVSVEVFPAPARAMSAAHAQQLAAERHGGMKVLAVTPIAFDDDSTQALVYYETWCGSLCGGGYELWLVRGPDERWRLRQEMIHWMS